MIEKIAHKLTRKPRLVALIAVLMLIPSLIGYAATQINYDILSYLPQDLPSSQGEQLLEDPFQMAATSMLIVEGMPAGYTNKLIQDIQDIPGVSSAVWLSNLVGIQVPVEMIPADLREMFFSGQATMMLIQYDHPGPPTRPWRPSGRCAASATSAASWRASPWSSRIPGT